MDTIMDNSVFYHIYPLGFCGAPLSNDNQTIPRIKKVTDWIPHIKQLGADAVYFGPVFSSDNHGYDTRDYATIDCRLGSNKDFKAVCDSLHQSGIKMVVDGVFNHVGRGFWAFTDVLQNREGSPYKDWFNISFDGNSPYNDRLWYEGWEGHYELVKLNLRNQNVVDHLFWAIGQWIEQFNIDGIRLDVAYLLDRDFMRSLKAFCRSKKSDFFLIGEMLFGDYNQIVNEEMLDSCTNYEGYKSLYSAFNSLNMFEVVHSLNRQYGPENWTLYKGKHLLTFLDNHDVSRIGTILTDKNHLPLAYGMLFLQPGIPCIYYGSEWGAQGAKQNGDPALRPSFDNPIENDLTAFISKLANIRKSHKAITHGGFSPLALTNKQTVFLREYQGERIIGAINADHGSYKTDLNLRDVTLQNLLTGEEARHNGTVALDMPPYSFNCYKII